MTDSEQAQPRTLREQLTAYRIGDADGRFSIYSSEGARRYPGRWNAAGDAVIYASEHYSTALLEKLVHWNGSLPPNQHYIEIQIPSGVSYEIVTKDILPDWHEENSQDALEYGHDWYEQIRSLILIVPSVVARMENNIIINENHKDFSKIKCSLEMPVKWDGRLFD